MKKSSTLMGVRPPVLRLERRDATEFINYDAAYLFSLFGEDFSVSTLSITARSLEFQAEADKAEDLFQGWNGFFELLRNKQPPRSLSGYTADDAVEFLSRLPSDKIEAIVANLNAANFFEVTGGAALGLIPEPTSPVTSSETLELTEKLQLKLPEDCIVGLDPILVIYCGENQDSEEIYFISYTFHELRLHGFTPLRCDLTRSTLTGNPDVLYRSRVGIIIFSMNYARSRECLDEFVAIMDLVKANNLVLLPVFFKVSVLDVMGQSASFEKAFTRLGNSIQASQVLKWRAAMIELSSINIYHQYMKG